eukprot:1385236-Amorphochlora_amoeboformis.AAC.1
MSYHLSKLDPKSATLKPHPNANPNPLLTFVPTGKAYALSILGFPEQWAAQEAIWGQSDGKEGEKTGEQEGAR